MGDGNGAAKTADKNTTAVLDLDGSLQFLKSAALARAFQEHTQAEWRTYSDSTVLNICYAWLPWKEPVGFMAVDQSPRKLIQRRATEIYDQLVESWLTVVPQGPAAVKNYLERVQKVRDGALEAVQSLFTESGKINQQVLDELRTAIRCIAAVQLVGTIALPVLGVAAAAGMVTIVSIGGSMFAVGGVCAGYSMTSALVKNWDDLAGAAFMAVMIEKAKWLYSESLGKGIEMFAGWLGDDKAAAEKTTAKATKRVEHYQKQLKSKRPSVVDRAKGKVAEQQARREAGERAAENLGKTAARTTIYKWAVPVLFAAWDIKGGIEDYADVWTQTK